MTFTEISTQRNNAITLVVGTETPFFEFQKWTIGLKPQEQVIKLQTIVSSFKLFGEQKSTWIVPKEVVDRSATVQAIFND